LWGRGVADGFHWLGAGAPAEDSRPTEVVQVSLSDLPALLAEQPGAGLAKGSSPTESGVTAASPPEGTVILGDFTSGAADRDTVRAVVDLASGAEVPVVVHSPEVVANAGPASLDELVNFGMPDDEIGLIRGDLSLNPTIVEPLMTDSRVPDVVLAVPTSAINDAPSWESAVEAMLSLPAGPRLDVTAIDVESLVAKGADLPGDVLLLQYLDVDSCSRVLAQRAIRTSLRPRVVVGNACVSSVPAAAPSVFTVLERRHWTEAGEDGERYVSDAGSEASLEHYQGFAAAVDLSRAVGSAARGTLLAQLRSAGQFMMFGSLANDTTQMSPGRCVATFVKRGLFCNPNLVLYAVQGPLSATRKGPFGHLYDSESGAAFPAGSS
jgi:hypothetical protein